MLENVNNTRVVQSARIKLNGQVEPIHQVTYMIGEQGPFTDAFANGDFTPENVEAKQAERIVSLHRIGVALPVPPVEHSGEPGVWDVHRSNPGGPHPVGAPILPPPPYRHVVPLKPVGGPITGYATGGPLH